VYELERGISWHSVPERDVVDAEAFLSLRLPIIQTQGTVFTARCLPLLDAFDCQTPNRGFAASEMLESRTPHGRRRFQCTFFWHPCSNADASLPISTVENRSFLSIYEAIHFENCSRAMLI
jgi:hypothetical protein